MSALQAANVLRGLSAVRHRLPPELVLRLAAGAVADGGAALRLAPDVDVRDLCFGLAGQVCACALERLRAYAVRAKNTKSECVACVCIGEHKGRE